MPPSKIFLEITGTCVRDPLFGKQVDESYDRLFRRIKGSTGTRLAG